MRKSSVSSITYGALFCALIGVLVYANRLFAGAFELYFFWIIPIPVVIYILKFGVKQAYVMVAAMILLTAILSGVISAGTFYVLGSVVAGLAYGSGLLKKKSSFNLICRVIMVSLVMMVITTFIAASFFGYNIADEVKYMGELMLEISSKIGGANQAGIEAIVGSNKLLTIVIISYILSSVLEGFLVHLFTYIALKRFKLPTPEMVTVADLKAPGWLKLFVFAGIVATLLSIFTGVKTFDDYLYPVQVIVAFTCYIFGYLYIITYFSIVIPNKRTRASITLFSLILSFFFPYIYIGLGLLDMFTKNRQILVERARAYYAEQQNRQN